MKAPEVRVEARFKNARLFNLISEESVPTKDSKHAIALQRRGPISAWCRANGFSAPRVIDIVSLREKPWVQRKDQRRVSWTKLAMRLSMHFGVACEELFPLGIYEAGVSAMVTEVSADRFSRLVLTEAMREDLLAIGPANAFALKRDQEMAVPVVAQALKTLTPRENMVIAMRCGLEYVNGKTGETTGERGRIFTLDEVGKKLGVQRERVRQIEARAIRRLRHPSRSRKLRPFHDALNANHETAG